MTAVRTGAQRRRPRAARPRRPPAPRRRLPSLWPPVGRRVLLACVLLAVVLFPVTGLVSAGQPQQAACRGCGVGLPSVGQQLGGPAAGRAGVGGQRGHRARRRPGLRGGGRRNRGCRRRADADRVRPRRRPPAVADDARRAGRRVDHVGPRLAGGGHRRDPGGRRPGQNRGGRRRIERRGVAALPGRGLRRRGRGVARDHRRRRPQRRDQLRQQERARPLVPRDRPGQVLAGGRDDALRGGVRRRLPGLVSGDRPAGHEPQVRRRTTAELPARPALLRHAGGRPPTASCCSPRPAA